jgi:hypothetical protein
MDSHVAMMVGKLRQEELLRSLPPVHDHGGVVVEFRHGWAARWVIRFGHLLTRFGQRLSQREASNPMPTFTVARRRR